MVVESLWDTARSASCLCHLLDAGPWASCLRARSLSSLICKMGMLSSYLLGLLSGMQRRPKHLTRTEHSCKEVMLLWLQDGEAHIAGALAMLAGLVTNVLAFFPLFSSFCPGTRRRLDLLFTFAHAVSPSVVPPSPLPAWTSSRPRCRCHLHPGTSVLSGLSIPSWGTGSPAFNCCVPPRGCKLRCLQNPAAQVKKERCGGKDCSPFRRLLLLRAAPILWPAFTPRPHPLASSLWRVGQSGSHLLCVSLGTGHVLH